MARIPPATLETIPADQRAAYEEVLAQRGTPRGPITIMINVPEISKRASHLGNYLREESTIPRKLQELAMLTTARELDCQFIWYAHAPSGRKAGLADDTVDGLRDRKDLPGLPPDEAAVVSYGREFFRTHRVSQATFDAAMAQFGVRGLTELTNLMSYYALLAFNINAFEVGIPDDGTEPALPV